MIYAYNVQHISTLGSKIPLFSVTFLSGQILGRRAVFRKRPVEALDGNKLYKHEYNIEHGGGKLRRWPVLRNNAHISLLYMNLLLLEETRNKVF